MSAAKFLVYNAKIWQSGKQDFYWMVFNRDTGYIHDCGTVDNVPNFGDFSEDSKRNYQCRRIFPGFQDSHIHIGFHGEFLTRANLRSCSSIQEMQRVVAEYRAKNPNKSWILGGGWQNDSLGRYPTKHDLDEVCPDKPVFLHRVCLHVGVANSKALEIAGISRDTKIPSGIIDRDENDEPTGVLREEAISLFASFLTPDAEEIKSYIEMAVNDCLRNGITSAHACESDTWKQFCGLDDQGKLPIRIFYSAYYHKQESGHFPSAGEKHSKFLSCDRIKIFADGGLGAKTAALSLPYKGCSEKGVLIHTEEKLLRLFRKATSEGYRLEVHVIGDAAADAVLTAMEAAQIKPEKRPLFIHCQVLREDLLPRMKALGIIANIQPSTVPSEASWPQLFLPTELQTYTYPWKSLLNAGILCAGGSDAPVEPTNPFLGIHAAIFRPSGPKKLDLDKPFQPEERLSVTEALDMYTRNGAFAAMREHDLGQLAPGFQADFVVIKGPEDVVERPETFLEAEIAEVWVAGKQLV